MSLIQRSRYTAISQGQLPEYVWLFIVAVAWPCQPGLGPISVGNRMDESAIWEKIAWQQENRTRRSRVLLELL